MRSPSSFDAFCAWRLGISERRANHVVARFRRRMAELRRLQQAQPLAHIETRGLPQPMDMEMRQAFREEYDGA